MKDILIATYCFYISKQKLNCQKTLRAVQNLVSIDVGVQLSRQALCACDDRSAPEAKKNFIGNLKQDFKLYMEERQPVYLEHAIQLAQSRDAIRKGNSQDRFKDRGSGRGGKNNSRNGEYNRGKGYYTNKYD